MSRVPWGSRGPCEVSLRACSGSPEPSGPQANTTGCYPAPRPVAGRYVALGGGCTGRRVTGAVTVRATGVRETGVGDPDLSRSSLTETPLRGSGLQYTDPCRSSATQSCVTAVKARMAGPAGRHRPGSARRGAARRFEQAFTATGSRSALSTRLSSDSLRGFDPASDRARRREGMCRALGMSSLALSVVGLSPRRTAGAPAMPVRRRRDRTKSRGSHAVG